MELNESLGYVLNLCARLMKRDLERQLKEYDITTSQWAALKLLSQESNLTQAEMAEKLNSDRATVGSVLDKLIRKNYVTKTLREDDRRSYRVEILPAACELVESISAKAKETNRAATEGLSKNEVEILINSLKTIIDNLGGEKDDLEI